MPATTYRVRAYATNVVGTTYGDEIVFTSQPIPATVVTGDVSGIATTTARVTAEVVVDGGAAVTERGVCYNTSGAPTIADGRADGGAGLGAFTRILTGLTPGVTCYVRAYAVNAAGVAYGEERSFTTTIPDLHITVETTTTDSPLVGQQVHFLTAVSNTGTAEATDVIVMLPIPPNAEFVSATMGGQPSGQIAGVVLEQEAGRVKLFFGNVPPGQDRRLTVVLRVIQAGPIQVAPTATCSETRTPASTDTTQSPVLNAKDDYVLIAKPPLACGAMGAAPLALGVFLMGRMRRY